MTKLITFHVNLHLSAKIGCSALNMAPVNRQNIEAARTSHIALDSDDWYTNFPEYVMKSKDELLFFVSSSRQVGRWFGYIFSLGISTVGGNRLSEMSIRVEGEDSEAILQEFVDEYERSPGGISPAMIKSTIKRNNWFVIEYKNNENLRICSSGFRVHITIRKTP